MADEKFMRLAIAKAREGIAKGQEPFGACVVKGREVVSVAHNTKIEDMDVTAHEEYRDDDVDLCRYHLE